MCAALRRGVSGCSCRDYCGESRMFVVVFVYIYGGIPMAAFLWRHSYGGIHGGTPVAAFLWGRLWWHTAVGVPIVGIRSCDS